MRRTVVYCRVLSGVRAIAVFVLLSGIGTAAPAVRAATLDGRVEVVSDGDTIVVVDRVRRAHIVRIAAIDAPEIGQPSGYRAKDALARLVRGREVRVDWVKRDANDRLLGKVWVAPPDVPCPGQPECPKSLDAGLWMVAHGRAWWFRRFSREQSQEDRAAYRSAEEAARARKLGFWRNGNPVAPWLWRRDRATRQ